MKKYLFLSVAVFALAACDSDEGGKCGPMHKIPVSNEIDLTIDELSVNQGLNSFAFDFLNEVALSGDGRDDNGNLCVSPLSASFALAMLANSADEVIAGQVAGILGAENLPALNSTTNKLLRYMPSRKSGARLELVNSAWYHDDYVVSRTYEDNMAQTFYAEVNGRDFDDPATLGFINGWCNEKSHGMIPRILETLSARQIFILANALYFSGKWNKPFDVSDTRDMEFTGTVSKSIVKMMHSEGKASYMESDLADAAVMSFDGSTRFVALLPKDGSTAEDLARSMTRSDFRSFTAKPDVRLTLDMPRFGLSNSCEHLYDIFVEMGLGYVMTLDKMGLSNVSPEAMFAIQKTAVQLDEEGAELAAVTVIGGDLMPPPPIEEPEVKHLVFDRPFLFFVENTVTGTILMAGLVNNL